MDLFKILDPIAIYYITKDETIMLCPNCSRLTIYQSIYKTLLIIDHKLTDIIFLLQYLTMVIMKSLF